MNPRLLVFLFGFCLAVSAADAQAAGAILFQDDFSKPANGWMATKTDYAEFSYIEGAYRIFLSKPDFNTYSYLPNQTFENVSVEADVRLAAGPSNGVFGILCRADADQKTLRNGYVFAIRTDGVYAIMKRTSPTFWDAIVYGKESKAIKKGDAVNHLRADCSGATLTFYINGEKVLEKTDSDFKKGGVGLTVTTQPKSEPLDVRFDNFIVRAIAP